MSDQITTSFVEQYKAGVEFLAQQKGSRLAPYVSTEMVDGKTAFFDQIGSVSAQRVLNRHGDSPLNPTPHARRRVTMFDYDTGDLVSGLDKIRTLNDPTNAYVQAHGWAMGRARDDEIIDAFFGTAYTGVDGSTSTSFLAANQVAVAAAGLTIAKLRSAKEILDSSEATDPDEERYIALSAKQVTNLLATTEITSSDYNTVKALVEGKVDTFMGFKFIRTERLPVDGSGYRRLMCWVKSGVKLGIGMNPTARIAERADKRFEMYVYFCQSLGATRMQEEKCVEIKCSES